MASYNSIVKRQVKGKQFEAFPFDVWEYCIKPFITTSLPKKCAICQDACELNELHLYKQTTYQDYRCSQCYCMGLTNVHRAAIDTELAKPLIRQFEKSFGVNFEEYDAEFKMVQRSKGSYSTMNNFDKNIKPYCNLKRKISDGCVSMLLDTTIFPKKGGLKKAKKIEKIVIKVLKSFWGISDCTIEVRVINPFNRTYSVSSVSLV
jgi:hypothetical protein